MKIKIEKVIKSKGLIYTFLCLGYTVFLLMLCYGTIIREDEYFTLHTTQQSITYAINQAFNFEGQPPLYFVLLNVWRTVSLSLFFARIFSLISILTGGFLLWRILNELLKIERKPLIVSIFLLNPFIVLVATDTRLYAFVVMLSLASAYFFYKSFFKESHKINKVLFVTISLLGILTQYHFIFLIAAQGIFLLFKKGVRESFKLILILIPVLVIFLIMNLLVITRDIELHQGIEIQFSFFWIKHFIKTFQNFLFYFDYLKLPIILKRIVVLFFLIPLIILIYSGKLTFTKVIHLSSEKYYFLTIVFLTALLIRTSFFIFHIFYVDKYIIIVLPILLVLFTLYFLALPRRISLIWLYALLFYYCIIDFSYFRSFVKEIDYQVISEYVENIEEKNQPILVYRNSYALCLGEYYKGSNELIQIPQEFTYDLNCLKNSVMKDTNMMNDVFFTKLRNDSSFILVTDEAKFAVSQDMNIDEFNQYIHNKFITKSDTMIFGRSNQAGLRVRKIIKY